MDTRDGTSGDSGAGRDREARWFGDRQVSPEEKTGLVHGVFSRVARRYDLMNDLMSGGIHRLWKDRFTTLVAPRPGERILDVAGGTGDIAFRFLDRAPGVSVVVADLTEGMVRVGRDRAFDSGRVGDGAIAFTVADAAELPFPDRSMNAYSIAFGLRNVTRIDAALAEARRVLKPGGRFFCLEFSHVARPLLARAYRLYSDAIIPRLGAVVARDRESYAYLVESIRRFPDQQSLAGRMTEAGFSRVRWRDMTGGIVAIHSGFRV